MILSPALLVVVRVLLRGVVDEAAGLAGLAWAGARLVPTRLVHRPRLQQSQSDELKLQSDFTHLFSRSVVFSCAATLYTDRFVCLVCLFEHTKYKLTN